MYNPYNKYNSNTQSNINNNPYPIGKAVTPL